MKIAVITVSLLIAATIIFLFILGVISKSGKASGLVDGRLSKCPHKPNCVCSEFKDDVKHYIDDFRCYYWHDLSFRFSSVF